MGLDVRATRTGAPGESGQSLWAAAAQLLEYWACSCWCMSSCVYKSRLLWCRCFTFHLGCLVLSCTASYYVFHMRVGMCVCIRRYAGEVLRLRQVHACRRGTCSVPSAPSLSSFCSLWSSVPLFPLPDHTVRTAGEPAQRALTILPRAPGRPSVHGLSLAQRRDDIVQTIVWRASNGQYQSIAQSMAWSMALSMVRSVNSQ
jgi:hypothetical protein